MCDIVWVSPQEHWYGVWKFPFLLTGTAVTVSGAKMVQERALLLRESKARLSDCAVVHKVCIDHRGQLPDSLHWLLTPAGSDSRHKGFRDVRRSSGGLEISRCSGQLSWARAFATSLSVAAFLRRAGGSMLSCTRSGRECQMKCQCQMKMYNSTVSDMAVQCNVDCQYHLLLHEWAEIRLLVVVCSVHMLYTHTKHTCKTSFTSVVFLQLVLASFSQIHMYSVCQRFIPLIM